MRRWLYTTLVNDPGLSALISGRVFQGEGMDTAQVVKPFVVYRMGNETDENLAEWDAHPRRVFFQVYVHDTGPDYQGVDEVIKAVKEALRNKSSASDQVMTVTYLETSRDLEDSTMQTVFRYVRFQAILS